MIERFREQDNVRHFSARSFVTFANFSETFRHRGLLFFNFVKQKQAANCSLATFLWTDLIGWNWLKSNWFARVLRKYEVLLNSTTFPFTLSALNEHFKAFLKNDAKQNADRSLSRLLIVKNMLSKIRKNSKRSINFLHKHSTYNYFPIN